MSGEEIIFLNPIYRNNLWGGRELNKRFGYELPNGLVVGECAIISGHPKLDCVVSHGMYKGKTLSWLWNNCRTELFGNMQGDCFPLIIKLLDANKDLSIQVHPNDEYAQRVEGESYGKKECWYIIDCNQDSSLIIGQNASNRSEFNKMAKDGDWDTLLNYVPINKGGFFQINAGTLHAIKAGTLVLEVQQCSDTTYRVYDYDRIQKDGTKRKLDIDKALDVIDYSAKPPSSAIVSPKSEGSYVLESNDSYTVTKIVISKYLYLPINNPFACVFVLTGNGTINDIKVRPGLCFLATNQCTSLDIVGEITLIIATS